MDGPDELPVEGDVVASKYRVERLVGEGAMGRVFRARHLLLGHDVAIKLLRTSVGSDELRTRFMREAKATMALRSDHIVRVFDLGVLPSNTPYMVLEYLEGTDLRALLETRGALPVAETVDYVLQACEALAEAHLNGIVHRDLKPQNLFLTRRSNGTACIKLLDFGVSKFEARSDS
jgi:serine/threonine-protein kinase